MAVKSYPVDAAKGASDSQRFSQKTLLKSERLLKAFQFRHVLKYGRTVSGDILSIQIWISKAPIIKLGLTVPKKFGKSVRRNHFKRLVREAFRHSKSSLPPGLHLNVRPAVKLTSNMDLHAIRQDLIALCKPFFHSC